MTKIASILATGTAFMLLSGCGPSDENNENHANHNSSGEVIVPETYTYESRFVDGESAVSYSGQIARHLLINELDLYIGNQLEEDALSNSVFGSQEDFYSAFIFYYEFDSDADGATELQTPTTPAARQATFNEVSTEKDLISKTAGNDSVTDHKDWSSDFVGWSDASIAAHGGNITSPEGLLRAFMNTLAMQAYDLSEGNPADNPIEGGAPLPVYVTPTGLDLKQLTQKFLLMSVAFSQGTDDYLDSSTQGKGLLSSNAREGNSPYSTLEHAWDEGFGYFGASRSYGALTDQQIADGAQVDTDEDGAIDFTAEYNFGASVNAAKRDLGSADGAKTNFTEEAFQAFLTGRAIINAAGDELTDEQLAALEEQRDIAVSAWEKAIAATAVHYINDTLQEMNKFGSEEYDFATHAKVWSELKGFSLGLQFNPSSPMNEGTRFGDFHALIKDAPVLPGAEDADITAYKEDLLEARAILGEAYGFDAANLGDEDGENGW